MTVLYTTIIAIGVVLAWGFAGRLFSSSPSFDLNIYWARQRVRCPYCDGEYDSDDIASRRVGFSGDSAGSTITCSSCHKSACFVLENDQLVFQYFAPTELLCLQCDNVSTAQPTDTCPLCGASNFVETEQVEGSFVFKPMIAANHPMQPSGEAGRFEVEDQPSPPADR